MGRSAPPAVRHAPAHREIGAESRLHLAARGIRQWPAAARDEPEPPGVDRECAAGAVPLQRARPPAKAGAGGPGGCFGALGWIGDGTIIFGWRGGASRGRPPTKNPWITLAVMLWIPRIPCPHQPAAGTTDRPLARYIEGR